MSRKIGVSVISLLPWSLGKNGLFNAWKLARIAGFDGLQLLPMRGWDKVTPKTIPPNFVISFEDAWNCGKLLPSIGRELHLLGENHPRFHDVVLFGACTEVKERFNALFTHLGGTAMLVTHNSRQAGVLEMNPEDNHTRHGGVCWDTKHVVRSGTNGESPITRDWRTLLEIVRHNVRLIHVNDSAPIDPKMLVALAEATDCPVIYEAKPPLKHILHSPFGARKRMLKWLEERRMYLEEFFG